MIHRHHFFLNDLDQMVILLCQVDHKLIRKIYFSRWESASTTPPVELRMSADDPIDAKIMMDLIAKLDDGERLRCFYQYEPVNS
jgi:hypothetical protein